MPTGTQLGLAVVFLQPVVVHPDGPVTGFLIELSWCCNDRILLVRAAGPHSLVALRSWIRLSQPMPSSS